MLYEEYLMPKKQQYGQKVDLIDRICVWTIRLSLVMVFYSLPNALAEMEDGGGETHKQNEDLKSQYFFACSGGKLDIVQTSLETNPNWVNLRTENGESCLHLTGIYGHSSVTKHLLEDAKIKADPNIRSTFDQGLRMHPLSWNVYGGHYDNIELLLKAGADPNLDFDSMGQPPTSVTSLDVVLQLQDVEKGDDRFTRLETLLRQYGGKTTEELFQEQQESAEERRDDEL